MLLDLNMWKNQIFYKPLDFGQYTGIDDRIYYVSDAFSLQHAKNSTIYSYAWRANTTDPLTNLTYLAGDGKINSRYRGYALALRGLAFIPAVFVFIMFGVLIYIFGREGTNQYESAEFKKDGVKLTGFKAQKSTKQDFTDGAEGTGPVEEKPGSINSSPKSYGSTSNRDDNIAKESTSLNSQDAVTTRDDNE